MNEISVFVFLSDDIFVQCYTFKTILKDYSSCWEKNKYTYTSGVECIRVFPYWTIESIGYRKKSTAVLGFYQRLREGLLHGHCVYPFTTGNH